MLSRISHYRIESEIGRGGMGVVYRAVDTKLGRPVAIKILQAEATSDADRHRRFVREAQSASALNHPNIVTIYEIGEDSGRSFIAMELVEGTPIDKVLAEGPLPVVKALEYGVQIAAAPGDAHEHGIIHRDIKPANIVITRDGRAKVLDFGLAKLVERGPTEATITAVATQAGVIMGTAAYMSPEQAEGRLVTAQSDVFSFGAVLYEMLAGRHPFSGATHLSVITSILRDHPPAIRATRPDVPYEIDVILQKALAKDSAARYQTAAALHADLASVHAKFTRAPESAWRHPKVLVPAAMLLLAVAAFGVWQIVQARRARWARKVAIPEIEGIQLTDRSLGAFSLAREAEKYAPDEIARVRASWLPFGVSTEPAGATVEIKNYTDLDGAWVSLGASPVQNVLLPLSLYRVRITRSGYVPVEVSSTAFFTPGATLTLATPESTPAGMVFVSGGRYSLGVAKTVDMTDFWIDRHEVTNKEFKRFVDAGGYSNSTYWTQPLQLDARLLTFKEAMTRFRDATGRSGPATWELGSFPDGQADFPVAGISWFEAAAYAEFAGKSLPTIYHWLRASGADDLFSDMLRLSNFDGKGTVRAGERRGVGPWGATDMAGNVKEWCANAVEGRNQRYILGGSWNEPSYRFRDTEARDPWDRHLALGVRLVKSLGSVRDDASAPVATVYGDPKSLVPVNDQEFDVLKRFYAYEWAPLNARTESIDDTSPYWRKETVSFDAVYGGERIPAYLFLPKNASPPYQTIVHFPSGFARESRSSQHLDYGDFEFLIRSGRALLYPVYKGTYERGGGQPAQGGTRDMNVAWGKDFLRAVDYLATRKEVAGEGLGFYAVSMGAFFAPVPLALEPRMKAAVILAGGLRFNRPPETQPANFMPRVKIPVLVMNGRDDFSAPYAAQIRLFELLGTSPEHKKHVALEGGHAPNDIRGVYRETLDWFDRYLGPVK